MITGRVQKNVATAKQYFREHLATGEYYTEGSRVLGRWFGQGRNGWVFSRARPWRRRHSNASATTSTP
jgi:hypothetical protein